jgi:hypothetical protein
MAQVNSELFVDGEGKQVEVHEKNDDCEQFGCCIHKPSAHPLRGAPLIWRIEVFRPPHMVRVCECGASHPDFDSLEYLRRIGKQELAATFSVHACCGHCIGTKFA